MNRLAHRLGSYADVAAEYYDAVAHPTCRNFREASAVYLAAVARRLVLSGTTLDVGAGRSLAADLLLSRGVSLDGLVLLDNTPAMLRHSSGLRDRGAKFVVGDATAFPIRDASFRLVVSSLGDPYNVPQFWGEVMRCLEPGGCCVFTTPSFEWADRFRRGRKEEVPSLAYFRLRTGAGLHVPSFVLPAGEQVEMIRRAGLLVEEVAVIPTSEVQEPISSKLLGIDKAVEAYLVQRPL